jgi:hypothetical protein
LPKNVRSASAPPPLSNSSAFMHSSGELKPNLMGFGG